MSPSREQKAAAAAAAGTVAAAAAGIGIKRLRDGDGRVFDSDAYELLEGESGMGVKRVLLAQVDDATAQLRGETGSEPAVAIHEARKHITTSPITSVTITTLRSSAIRPHVGATLLPSPGRGGTSPS